jgi:uncharacterized HAD superfamily protein
LVPELLAKETPRVTEHEPSIGVDLDGVLANQVVGVLPRIKADFGVELTYDDVTDWELPIIPTNGREPTDIAVQIKAAQKDRDYVLSMPVHAGARQMMVELGERFRVVVLTARSGEALGWSAEWLALNELPFDEIVEGAEAQKSRHGVHALVDDFLGNATDFLLNTPGPAVLVDQPWNRVGREALTSFIETGRLAVVTGLDEVVAALANLEPVTAR